MDTLRSILRDLTLAAYAVAGVFLCLVLWKASKALDQGNIALATVNAPCKDNGHQVVCGTLAGVNQAVKNTGILAAQSAEQVKQSGALISSAATTINTVGQHLSGTADALSETATTASRSLQDVSDHLTPVLDSANATTVKLGSAIDALQPVETDADKAVKDFDTRVTSKDVDRALKGLADTSQQAALTTTQFTGIATDLHKATSDATKPQPWWRKALGYGNMGVNIACLATRSCPF